MNVEITEVWGQLLLSEHDRIRVQDFFHNEIGINTKFIVKNMHISVYYARRKIPNLEEICEEVSIDIPAQDFRFMVMVPGGENAREDIEPAQHKIGLRIHKASHVNTHIQEYRNRLIQLETKRVLGDRKPSTKSFSAFGSRHFQPHMTVLRSGNGIDRDLKIIGDKFRETMGVLNFNKFVISESQKIIKKNKVVS